MEARSMQRCGELLWRCRGARAVESTLVLTFAVENVSPRTLFVS